MYVQVHKKVPENDEILVMYTEKGTLLRRKHAYAVHALEEQKHVGLMRSHHELSV